MMLEFTNPDHHDASVVVVETTLPEKKVVVSSKSFPLSSIKRLRANPRLDDIPILWFVKDRYADTVGKHLLKKKKTTPATTIPSLSRLPRSVCLFADPRQTLADLTAASPGLKRIIYRRYQKTVDNPTELLADILYTDGLPRSGWDEALRALIVDKAAAAWLRERAYETRSGVWRVHLSAKTDPFLIGPDEEEGREDLLPAAAAAPLVKRWLLKVTRGGSWVTRLRGDDYVGPRQVFSRLHDAMYPEKRAFPGWPEDYPIAEQIDQLFPEGSTTTRIPVTSFKGESGAITVDRQTLMVNSSVLSCIAYHDFPAQVFHALIG